MTTFQDQPPLSRRAIRNGERADGSTPDRSSAEQPFPDPGEPLNYVTQNRPLLPAYHAPAHGRRAAAPTPRDDAPTWQKPAPEHRTDGEEPPQRFRRRDYSPEGRLAPPSAWITSPVEGGVVDYQTAARPPQATHAPGADDGEAQPRDAQPAHAAEQPDPDRPQREQSHAEQSQPEQSHAEPETPAPTAWAQPVIPAPTQTPTGSTGVGSLAAALTSEPGEHTMTRRELRALREASGIRAVETPPEGTPLTEPAADRAALAEFEALTGSVVTVGTEPPTATPAADPPFRGRRAARLEAEALRSAELQLPVPAVEQQPFTAQPPAEPAPLVEPPAPTQAAFEAQLASAAPVAEPTPAAQSQPQFAWAPPPQAAEAPHAAAPMQQPAPVPPPVAPSTLSTGERPIGHWTNQADLDDQIHGSLMTGSRGVGTGGVITANALVLPSLPGQDMLTGEVMVTGSINLPETLASTGAHPSHVDQSDLDHLLDAEDEQVVNTDSIPVRAIKAVSSHTSTRGVMAAQKPKGTKALTALIISASGMAVVVVTLLVVAIATNVFGS